MSSEGIVTLARYETEKDHGQVSLAAFYDDGSSLPVQAVKYHSPSGIEYGYAGSGPADMALTILAHFHEVSAIALASKLRDGGGHTFTDPELLAINFHHDFKFEHISNADRTQPLIIHRSTIVEFMARQTAQ